MDTSTPHTTDLTTAANGNGASTSRRKFLGGLAVSTALVSVPGVAAAQAPHRGGRAIVERPKPANLSSSTTNQATSAARSVPESRRAAALAVRQQAAALAANIEPAEHIQNGDERADLGYALSFTKGLPHNYETGLIERPGDFEQFVHATNTGLPQDFVETPLGPDQGFKTAPDDSPLRAWESQSIGLTFDLVGPDMQALTMPPAPRFDSLEQGAEMAEVYAQAILRDEPLAGLRQGAMSSIQQRSVKALNELTWFDSHATVGGS